MAVRGCGNVIKYIMFLFNALILVSTSFLPVCSVQRTFPLRCPCSICVIFFCCKNENFQLKKKKMLIIFNIFVQTLPTIYVLEQK